MNFFSLNLTLAIVWTFLTGSFTIANFLFGLVVALAILWVGQPYLGSGRYLASVSASVRFVAIYLKEIVLANVQLARDLLKPVMPFEPGIIEFQTRDLSKAEVAVLANMISLTPGTVSMDTDESGTIIYIHSVYAGDPNEVRVSTQRLANLIESIKRPSGISDSRRYS